MLAIHLILIDLTKFHCDGHFSGSYGITGQPVFGLVVNGTVGGISSEKLIRPGKGEE